MARQLYRKATDRSLPAAEDSPRDARLAVWQADVQGLRWLDELPSGECALLAVNGGYPTHYTARASAVVPLLRSGPPAARSVWQLDADSIVDPARWEGRTVVDEAAIAACSLDEWLLIEAWDES